ncbi:hypothetical protein [Candidatus Xianfuyuplasma coldseepsis]|uniref:Uncharacterized protein n=1 Tax=Candidatus Xianfuyuplasma coldseepsis TaxID=2782163 RepID=A0A7L7KSH6_9MOLU|nr:hypothetical protein [Xianfuyuplasma coldseepsis]QMS85770.1 hypothetical protein G4Z02_08435 [Xianfuyuplasma coldseepsis]
MKNKLLLLVLILLLATSVFTEPLPDVIDTFAGATNPSFDPKIDDIAGVSEDDHDDDEHEDDDDEEDDD